MMRITTDRAELVSAVTWAAKGISKRAHVPTLAGMRIEVGGSRIEMAGFDYDMTCTARVAGSVAGVGMVLVNGAQLLATVKALPKTKGALVTLDADDTALTVSCDGATSRIELLDFSEYPSLPEVPPIAGTADAATLAAAVGRVALAAGRDDTLPSLTCVRFRLGIELELAATDRYRAHVESVEYAPQAAAPDAIIPAKPLTMACKEMAKSGEIALHVSEQREPDGWCGGFAALVTETRTLIVRTCNPDQFPASAIRNLWPEVTDTVTVDGPMLARVVKCAAGNLNRNEPVRLEFGPTSTGVIAVRDDSEAYRKHVPSTGVPGDVLTVRFAPQYIADALTAAGAGATLGLTEPRLVDGLTASAPKRWSFKPVTVTAASGTFRALVMSFKVDSNQDAAGYRRPIAGSRPLAA